jgi:hypothetical protein
VSRWSEARRESQKKYRESENGKAVQKAFRESGKWKEYRKAWEQSEEGREWYKAYKQSEKGKEHLARSRARNFGITVSRLQELLAAGCYSPTCDEKQDLAIDHDHSCCPGRRSCGKCVRGALCRSHNTYLGYLENDWSFAIWALRQPSLVLKVRREA